jgi:hypothetical protein
VQAALGQMADYTPLRSCWIHGDFGPWNLKNQPGGTLGLIDWESGWRGGLPMQDAFYYIHLQRYMFSRKPRPAYEEVSDSASALGISGTLCRKLELAFLTKSYLAQLRSHRSKCSDYLLSILKIAVHACPEPARSAVLAGAACRDFLTPWKDADPDIPIYKQAKPEYAKLQ